MFPDVAILVVTYNRAETLIHTLNALKYHLRYSGKLRYFIADDGSDDGTQELAKKLHPHAAIVQSHRAGLGGNTNAGLDVAFRFCDYVLQLQDDMQLRQDIDLDAHVARLRDYPQDGFIRLWGVGGHNYTATLDEGYWRVAWDSNELYIPSDRPHLKHKRFHNAFGLYPLGYTTGDTEEAWCHQVRDIARAAGGPSVLVPASMELEHNFAHVGHVRWRDKGL